LRVLITGISGFGGSGIAKKLLEEGFLVRGIDVTAPHHAVLLREVIDQIDYKWKSNFDVKREDIADCDIVLHLAAQADVPMSFTSPAWTIYNNVMGTVSVLEACKKARRLQKFILASSANTVQTPKYLPIDTEHPLSPSNPYGASKAAQELMAWAWYRSFNVPICIYRNGVSYGENMRREIFIFKWLWNIINDKPCVLEGGNQTRDPTYISDTLDAWMLGIEAEPDKVVGQVFQISYGKEYKVSEILSQCFRACNKTVPIIEKPHRLGEKHMRECFDISKATRVLGYHPKVPLEAGLKLTAKWVRTLVT
jgi:UDP-glucose 4-epimerase